MKKIMVVGCYLVLLLKTGIISGQSISFSVGGEVAIPGSSSGLDMTAETGFGGSARLELSFNAHLSGIATIGYLVFPETHPYPGTPATTSQVKAIPIQFGIKYYTQKTMETKDGLFITAEAGIMPTTTQFTYEVNPEFNFKEKGFSVAPGIGYQLGNLESGFRLQYNLTASGFKVYYYNFRVAYCFLRTHGKN